MGTLASVAYQCGWIPEGPVAYELFSTTSDVVYDQKGNPSVGTVSVTAYRLNGTARTRMTVNTTGSEYCVILRVWKSDGSELAAKKATETPASALRQYKAARFDLVPVGAVSATLTYDQSAVVASRQVNLIHDGASGEAGARPETVFVRCPTKPATPTGGTYTNPYPTSKVAVGKEQRSWTDSPPSGTDPVWMSKAVFLPTHTTTSPAWSDPVAAVDSTDIDIIWSKAEAPKRPTSNPFDASSDTDWSKTATDAIWMAIATKSNGAWGSWQTMRIKGEVGQNSVLFTIDPNPVEFKRGSFRVVHCALEINDGGVPVKPDSMVNLDGVSGHSGTLATGLTWTWSSDYNGRVDLRLTYDGSADIQLDKTVTVNYKGQSYSRLLQIRTVADGDKGEKGDDAVMYRLALTPSALTYDRDALTYDSSTVKATVSRITGKTEAAVTDLAAEGLTLTYDTYVGGTKKATVAYSGAVVFSSVLYSRLDFTLKKGDTVVATQTLGINLTGRSITGPRGPFSPPPQLWTDYPVGYEFQDGVMAADGKSPATRKDSVYYGMSNGMLVAYECIKSHTKGDLKTESGTKVDDTPDANSALTPADNPNRVWKRGIEYNIVATNVILAMNAYIELLSSQGIRIYDAANQIVGQMSAINGAPSSGSTLLPFFIGGVMNEDGSFSQTPLFAVDINGRTYHGGLGGRHIEIDPLAKTVTVYDDGGVMRTLITGERIEPADAVPGNGSTPLSATVQVSQVTVNDVESDGNGGWMGAKTSTYTLGTAVSNGTVSVSVPSFALGLSGNVSAAVVRLSLTVNNVEQAPKFFTTQKAGTITVEASTFRAHVKKGDVVKMRARLEAYYQSKASNGVATMGAFAVSGSITYEQVLSILASNGRITSSNSDNYCYDLYDTAGKLHSRIVSGGKVMFDTDTAGKHFN